MGDVVSLNKARKAAAAKAGRAKADVNAVNFGRTKAERELAKAKAEKTARDLEAHRRETE